MRCAAWNQPMECRLAALRNCELAEKRHLQREDSDGSRRAWRGDHVARGSRGTPIFLIIFVDLLSDVLLVCLLCR